VEQSGSQRRRWIIALSIVAVLAMVTFGLFELGAKRLADDARATTDAKREVERLGGVIMTGNRRGDHSVMLGGTNVCDEDLRRLEPVLARLRAFRYLELSGTRVSDVGLSYLRKYQSLQGVGLADTDVTEAGVRQLHIWLPNSQISYGKRPNRVREIEPQWLRGSSQDSGEQNAEGDARR